MPRWGYISFFSLLPLLQLHGGEQQATAFRRRFPPFSFRSGGRIGIREDGERGLRWPLCIVLPNKVSLGLRSVCSAEVMLQLRNKLLQLLLRLTGAIFGTSEGLLRYDLAGSGVPDGLDLVRVLRPSLILVGVAIGDGLGRYVYQLMEKLGWILCPTCFGFIPLWVVLPSGVLEFLVTIEAPDSLYSGDEMAGGHLLRPGRSAVTKYVDSFDMLLLVPTKICAQSSGRRSASSFMVLQPPATKTTGRKILQRLCCNSYFLQDFLCKIWNVNLMKYT